MGTISVANLGKAYRHYPSRWARLVEWLVPWRTRRHTLKWVLNDINFTVQAGEAVGIIGINGAGKSTLLKMITGTTMPTTGRVQLSGRVAALLELGIGFHPEFTGRQNAFMAGQLLGYSPLEIESLMPAIEAFAEIGDYIDEPVRVYSSGMQMRLAFSVATAIRPDILIVDEALSVGDAYFVHKSFDRIRQFRAQGTTLLIVSHDKQAIMSICDRALLLSEGRIAMEGEPEAVLDYYNALLAARQHPTIVQVSDAMGKQKTVSGTGEARITDVRVTDPNDAAVECLEVGSPYRLHVKARSDFHIKSLVFGFGFKDRLGQMVFGTNTFHTGHILTNVSAGTEAVFTIEFVANLGAGTYSVVVALTSSDTHLINNYEWIDRALILTVLNTRKPEFLGVLWLDHQTRIALSRSPGAPRDTTVNQIAKDTNR